MKISEMNWFQVEDDLKHDDRAIRPLGSTEQHAWLSLSVDSILSEKVALDAAEPLGIPVFPVQAYGVTPYFLDFPGSISLRNATYASLIVDILDSMARQGFKRILICNGHGGNSTAGNMAIEWMADNPGVQVRFHNWWNAPKTLDAVMKIDSVASHASWMENFPWTRLACAKCWVTAISAAITSGPMQKCRKSGTLPCLKPAPCWTRAGHDHADPDLGGGCHWRRHRRGADPLWA